MIYETIEKLHEDHENIATLLGLLKVQLTHLEKGEYVDMQILSDIMHYFTNYPDVHHHPHEEVIFDALKKKEINVADVIDEINSEHEQMAAESAEILDEVIQIQGNAIFSREEIVNRLSNYISIYYSHMTKEEDELFPLAKKILDESDWQEINKEILIEDDPLFGEILDNEYNGLYKIILAENKEEA